MSKRILVWGYGNPGRQDDGIGPALINKLREHPIHKSVTLNDSYQLAVEDAMEITSYDMVIFVDAAIYDAEDKDQAYRFYKIEPQQEQSFGSHSLSPEGLLQLSHTLYQTKPSAYMLAIQGIEFDAFEEKLSPSGQVNMLEAFDFLLKFLLDNLSMHASTPHAAV